MTLTAAQKAKIATIITYRAEGSAGKFIFDDVTAVELTTIFQGQGSFATDGKRPFYESFREAPVTTLLRALLDCAA